MSRRIDVELTSDRGDGTWTWRAAGAREPKGTVDADLLPPGAKVGDVLKADADIGLDGITITEVIPPRDARPEPERLEILGPPERPPAPPDDHAGERPRRPREARRRDGRPPSRPSEGERRPPRTRREAEPRGERAQRPRPSPPPPRPKPKKLRPGRTHRQALLDGLPAAQQPIAEQLLRGGMPAVRTALHEQNTQARKEGKPEAPVQAVITIAENLLPQVRRAEWLDRAEAAAAEADEISLRDLRSVVVSADDIARDDETRDLAARLRNTLERRSTAEADEWVGAVRQALDDGRVVRALRISSRAPEPGVTLPDDLRSRLAGAAGEALAGDVASDRWATVLDAVAWSPVRSEVIPSGTPAEPSDELVAAVRKHAGRLPAVAERFGVQAPPPRARRTGRRRDRAHEKIPAGPTEPGLSGPSEAPVPAAEPMPEAEPAPEPPAPTPADPGTVEPVDDAALPPGIRRITPAIGAGEPTAPTADSPAPHGDPLEGSPPDAGG